MSRSKSKVNSIANFATLENAGFRIDGDYYWSPDDTELQNPMTQQEALALYTRANGNGEVKAKRTSENRASAELVQLTRAVCQAYSNGFTQKYTWGEEEVSLKKVAASTVQAWCNSKYATEGCVAPTEKMVKNAISALKRNGEIESTKKGYFRASKQASIDWSQFI